MLIHIRQKYNLLLNTIIDTHFEERDRFGRLCTFVARLRKDNSNGNVIGIGVNERTAIVIDLSTDIGETVGSGDAYIILPGNNNMPQACEPNRPLTFTNVNVQKLESRYGDTFNFWTLTGGHPSLYYSVSVNNGQFNKNPYIP